MIHVPQVNFARDKTARIAVSDCHLSHKALNPYSPSCGWVVSLQEDRFPVGILVGNDLTEVIQLSEKQNIINSPGNCVRFFFLHFKVKALNKCRI